MPAPEGAREWDALVEATGRPHLLQSSGWARLKEATGWIAERYVLEDDRGRRGLAQLLVRRGAGGLAVAYASRGPICEPADLPAAIGALRTVAARHRTLALICDPEQPDDPTLRAALAEAGVSRSSVFVQPRRTLLLDPSREPDELLAAMRRKTRQYIRKAEREGVATEETTDLKRFHRILRIVGQRDRFAIHDLGYFRTLRDAFGERMHLLVARVGDEDAGTLLVVRIADRAWELFGGWSGAHAESRPFYLLKWRSLLRMRQLGVRRYDMWGLAEGPEDALAGVENFKLGFGGEIVEWIGLLETPVVRPLFPLWQLGARRRLAAARL